MIQSFLMHSESRSKISCYNNYMPDNQFCQFENSGLETENAGKINGLHIEEQKEE
ncbi:hypothetical protein PghCCS26_32410 [Paenibacillus glycanilyticus]|uniref:Uncharacterized protein n=1 Tax=Paenibacillus glycanilyticus TaxID=126569 RepID=A0ABQ6NMU6_9BACL|nr:hypothetical protein PghCCS26_32410 [Paenibacillus glycanilyticus]